MYILTVVMYCCERRNLDGPEGTDTRLSTLALCECIHLQYVTSRISNQMFKVHCSVYCTAATADVVSSLTNRS